MEMLEQNKIFLRDVITNGSGAISPIEPCQALKVIMSIPEEIPFKFSREERNEIYSNLIQDYPILENFYDRKFRGLKDSLTEDEHNTLEGLLKWLIQELRVWDETDDKNAKRLALVFIISKILIENLWELIPPSVINNPKLNTFLEGRFNKFQCNIVIPQQQQVPIWEKEAAQQYIKAIHDRDWQHLANKWHIWRHSPKLDQANTFQYQIFLFLLNYSPEQLIRTTNQYEDFISLMLICREHSFSLLQRFQLALDSTNELFRFALLFSLELNNDKYHDLTDEEADCFAQILQKIGRNSDQLRHWLMIFNCYPVRFPILAEGFGVYVAKYASETDIDLYLETIKVEAINPQHGYYDTRRILGKTFQKIAEFAESDVRKLFWSKCYCKWLAWNFGQVEEHYHLSTVHLSNIDYALVGYFIECQEQGDREEVAQNILKDIDSIFTKNWYGSQSGIITEFYNLLSKLQPVCYAGEVGEDGLTSWLMKPERSYHPTKFQTDERYRVAFALRDIEQ
ncbi:hypothetical protein Q5X64_15075 [Acinetobacter baumannii]|uniref:hypothetical protein n=1 Tax=Acinetobacter TaxID=469 RepID=UPI00270B8E59|nr:hypothetical protein [Acinetobacter baumannii]